MSDKLLQLSDITSQTRVAVVGDQGTGKTHLIGTLCALMPTLVVTADPGGLDTLRGMGVSPQVILVENWKFPWGYRQLAEQAYAGGAHALAIDDLGAIQGIIRADIEARPRGTAEWRDAKGGNTDGIRQELMAGYRRLEYQGWGSLEISLGHFLRELFGLGFDPILVTVLEEVRGHPRTGEDQVYPHLDGGIRHDLLAQFSFVGLTFRATTSAGATVFCLSTQPHAHLPTKDRQGQPRTWVNPDMVRVLRHIRGKAKPEDTETEQERGIGIGPIKSEKGR